MSRLLSALAATLLWLSAPAHAQTATLPTTDLLLALMVDASGSVNQQRFELQRRGYADAFRNRQVLNAIRGGSTGSIATMMVQWTGYNMQAQAVPWTLIKDEASANAFANAIEAAPRQLFGGGTSISGAIDHAMLLLPNAPFKGLKRVIDVSGDGSNNRGRDVREARDDAVKAGVVINGLPIVALECGLDKYYFDNVIGGPGAFIVPAELLRELLAGHRAQAHPGNRDEQSMRCTLSAVIPGRARSARARNSEPYGRWFELGSGFRARRHSASKTRLGGAPE